MIVAFSLACIVKPALSQAPEKRLVFREDGTFKLLHLSDVHYRVINGEANGDCRDIEASGAPCSGTENTTDFIRRLIALEKPDLVVHTGDVVDGGTQPVASGMDAVYGVSIESGMPWAASLGNHDSQSDMNRSEVMSYIMGLNNTLSQVNELGPGSGAVTESFGNFVLEIFASAQASNPSFRTFHLDSNTNDAPINLDQVKWFNETAASFAAADIKTPALMFTHVPLMEYWQAAVSGICGSVNEHISSETVNTGLLDAMVADGSVKATFVGHDHTNDYCGSVKGVQLCYEGSPGYQGYGHCLDFGPRKGKCFGRRARVTEIRNFGETVRSWKRVDSQPYPAEVLIDEEVLWSAVEKPGVLTGGLTGGIGEPKGPECPLTHIAVNELSRLPVLVQPLPQ
eukprot:CAMPEP_0171612100 /NCGR_PEP_ID=MMETSP0990-20121206/11010_1 /TAXON_ID=483369 /ORGANISM="non described non described, Strain CCMP2098" /LENGTH=397 /DNA_ID=CAMNT_0012175769 /DNA_START=145 /DNA_END=1338 /DNA_ORIENTATION=+